MTTKKDKKNKGNDDKDKDKDEEYEEEYENDDDDEEEYGDDDDEEEYGDDDDEEEEEYGEQEPSGGYFNKYDDENRKQNVFLILKTLPKKKESINLLKIKKIKYDFYKKYNNDEKKYFDSLSSKGKENIRILENKISANKDILTIPIRFKILDLDINERTKRSIIFKQECLNRMSTGSGEYHKINN